MSLIISPAKRKWQTVTKQLAYYTTVLVTNETIPLQVPNLHVSLLFSILRKKLILHFNKLEWYPLPVTSTPV